MTSPSFMAEITLSLLLFIPMESQDAGGVPCAYPAEGLGNGP